MKHSLAVLFSLLLLTQAKAQQPQYFVAEKFLQISGGPVMLEKNHQWAIIVISQIYDAEVEKPISFTPKHLDPGVSESLIMSHQDAKQNTRDNNLLSYNLKIYEVDFQKAGSVIFNRSDFEGLPSTYVPGNPITSGNANGDAVLKFTVH